MARWALRERDMGDSDLELLSRIRRHDTRALGVILERYWAPIVRYASTILDSGDAAEDIAQETFVRLWERREAWKPEGSVRALLLRVARNLSLDERRRRSASERAAKCAPRPCSRPAPDEEFESREIHAVLQRAIDSLPDRRREVLILVRYHGLSYREAADVLDLAPQTVANHLTLALAELRRLLARHDRDQADRASGTHTDAIPDRSA